MLALYFLGAAWLALDEVQSVQDASGIVATGGSAARESVPDFTQGLERIRQSVVALMLVLLSMLGLGFSYWRDRRLSDQRLAETALRDSLTGLPNRRVLRRQLETAIEQGLWGELALLKFERLTRVVHLYGPAFADHVLVAAAAALRNELKSLTGRDIAVFRLDGTTFAALLDNCTQAQAVKLLSRAQQGFEHPLQVEEREVLLALRAGLISYPDAVANADELLAAADTALRFARDNAQAPVLPYGSAMREQVARREMLEKALHTATRDGTLLLYYQPQISLTSGRLVGVEALLRWQHPDLGAISPAEFIPIAEETGLIVDIGRWVLNTACAQLADWLQAGSTPIRMSVNVSPRQLGQAELVDWVLDAIATYGLDPASLELEVTESFSLHDMELMSTALQGLRQTGVRIAIDDFGTGYSSLSYLRQLPVNVLKIDRSFIRALHSDTKRYDLVRIVVDLGHALGFEVVAEGVEELDEWRALHWLGCDTAQGYLTARPMAPADIEQQLTRDHWLPEGLGPMPRARKGVPRPLSRAV